MFTALFGKLSFLKLSRDLANDASLLPTNMALADRLCTWLECLLFYIMLEMTATGECVLIWGVHTFGKGGGVHRWVHKKGGSQGVHEKGGSQKGGFT